MANFKPFSKNNEEQAGQKKNQNTPLSLTDEEITTTEQPAPSQILLPYKNAEGKVTQLRFDFGQEYEPLPKDVKVVKRYKEKLPTADLLRFGNDFVNEVLIDEEAVSLTIISLKIIFNIISQLRDEQFQSANTPKLELFEREYMKESGLFGELTIKNSLITRNTEELKKAFFLLSKYKYDYYKLENLKGEKIDAIGGLISHVRFNHTKGYTIFLINSYWLNRLIHIDSYNEHVYRMVYKIRSTKHILFAFWLAKIPIEGTKIKLSTLNERFNLNYNTARDLCRDFLKGIRENLNKYNNLSFNYNYSGDVIVIKPYLNKKVDEELIQSTETKEEIEKNYKLRYYKDRHQLSEEEMYMFSFIYKNDKPNIKIIVGAYDRFISYCRERKEKATDYTGKSFLETLQKFIEIEYQEQNKNTKHIGAAKCFKIYDDRL